MNAIILAAGEGTRLRPHTLDRPKCLVEIDGRSLLDRQLAVLTSEQVNPIVIGGYRAEMLARAGVGLRMNPRYAETNMVWTLFCAEADLDDELIVSYADIVYSRGVLRALLASRADAAVTIDLKWASYWSARYNNPLDEAETLRLTADGRILELGKKPRSLAEVEGQYIGLMKFSARGVQALRRVFQDGKDAGVLQGKPVEKAYMTDLLQSLIDTGFPVHSVPVSGEWVEVDTVDDLRSAITRSRLQQIEEAQSTG